MIIDTSELLAHNPIEADLVIIGGGAAGISIAREYIGTKQTVAVLVSGGMDPGGPSQMLADGKNIGQPYFPLVALSTRCLGGNTTRWGSWCRRFDPFDFEKRSWVPQSGWPISLSELEPYYQQAHQILKLGAETFDPTEATRSFEDETFRPLPLATGALENKMWRFHKPPVCFGKDHLHELSPATNVTIYLNATVTEVLLDKSGSSVSGATLTRPDGKQLLARGKKVVVACGGIENPRLLLASRSVKKAGIGNDNDLVGRYFMEHPHLHHNGFIILKDLDSYPALFDTNNQYSAGIVGGLCPSRQFQEQEQILNSAINFIPSARSVDAVKLSDGLYETMETIVDRMAAFPGHAYRSIKKKLGWVDRKVPRSRFLDVITRSEQAPNPDSRITLTDELDAVGLPKAQLDWRLTGLDHKTIVAMHKKVAQEIGALGRGRMKIELLETTVADADRWSGEGEKGILGGGWHHMGTTRMADTPAKGVVDSNCKVFGVENLFVAGSSVFTTSSAFNPTMTIVAMALRLAGHLKGK